MILLTGFGSFLDVDPNPTAGLVQALHGRAAAGHRIVGVVLPVVWGEATRRTVLAARGASLVVGFGVARGRGQAQVEARGTAARHGVDAAGQAAPPAPSGPEQPATVDLRAFAEAIGAGVSRDAGRYLCNAWAHEVPPRIDAPCVFVHVPRGGIDPERVWRGLERYLTRSNRQRDSAAATS